MNAAIYARYSTEQQSAASVEDQVRVCRSRATREGWPVVATHGDEAISGTTHLASRPAGKSLIADLLAGRFNILIIESLDRLSRDQVEQETWVRRMEHRGIRLVGVSDGYDSIHSGRKIIRGVRGLINELYLDDLRFKTHRGQAGKVLGGYVAGGKSYGYKLVRHFDGERKIGSTYEIDEVQAHWVRWIFERFATGESCRKIVFQLNAIGVPSPRDGSWCVSAVYGAPKKGSGILNNALYVGRYIWNRSQWIKDPDSTKRQRIDRPMEEWHERQVPALRIVEDGLWTQVRSRIDQGRDGDGRKAQHRPPSGLFSGLIRCPRCEGKLTVVDATYYGCGRAKDRGPTVCRGFRLRRTLVDQRLTTILRENLLSPDAARQFSAAFDLELAEQTAASGNAAEYATAKLKRVEGEIARLVEAVATAGQSCALLARLAAAEREAQTLRTSVAPILQPGRTKPVPMFAEILMRLNLELQHEAAAARRLIAELIGEVVIEQRGDEVWAHLATDRLLMLAGGESRTDNVVAGTGFEPVTFGL